MSATAAQTRQRRRFPPIRGRTLDQRFWEKVDKSPGQGPKGDCWEWAGGRRPRGYGQFAIKQGVVVGAHVYSYKRTSGEVPEGMEVCHSCDNPPCCNPAHLYAGTHKQNMALAAYRGRGVGRPRIHPKKEKKEKARRVFITKSQSEQIKQMRIERDIAQTDLAYMAGVHFTHYCRFEKAERGLRLEQVLFIVRYLQIEDFDITAANIVDMGFEVKEPHKRPRANQPLPVESNAAKLRLGLISKKPPRKIYMTKQRREAQASASNRA
jgi:DNA-binding XRE family transcriptional regulator